MSIDILNTGCVWVTGNGSASVHDWSWQIAESLPRETYIGGCDFFKFWPKPKVKTAKFRSIIRKAKQKA